MNVQITRLINIHSLNQNVILMLLYLQTLVTPNKKTEDKAITPIFGNRLAN